MRPLFIGLLRGFASVLILPTSLYRAARRAALHLVLPLRIRRMAKRLNPENKVVYGYYLAPLLVQTYGLHSVIHNCADKLVKETATDVDRGIGVWLTRHVDIKTRMDA